LNLSLIAQHVRGEVELERGELAALVSEALDGAERVARIVRDLRSVTRHTEGPPGPVCLSTVVEAALRIAAGTVRAKDRLTTAFEPDVWVLGDAARLEQVLLNLVLNAAQAIERGTPEENEVHVALRAEGDQGVLTVRDTGSGIPPEVQPRIFDPFFTARRQGEGTGLGLAICHGLVTSMGGRIDFDTEVGRGTTFRVSLPRTAPASAPAPAPPEPRLEGLTVLVLDDEPAVAEALGRLLSGCSVTALTDARVALERLGAEARFDALLCDVRMSGLPGSEFFAQVRERFPQQEARVVFMKGAIADPDVQRFLATVSNPVLEKPFSPEGLVRAVRRVTGR
jgi:CheY-like chemotaxis protein/anti-sigma regulatory factor (Ser/Thr protein kinase)